MAKPTFLTPEQERKKLEEAHAKATRELAVNTADQKAVDSLGDAFIAGLKAFEETCRKLDITPEGALVVAAAIEASTKRRLLKACGAQKADTKEEADRIDGLRNDIHELSALGHRLEKRLIDQSTVTGVGKMTMNDVSKGS